MARRPRFDAPGVLHHVVNRATGKRPLFEVEDDFAFMMGLLERVVRAGAIHVLAFSLMGTHFHILLRSLDGKLSRTMQWLESTYVAWFNRQRERPGALVQGRFFSCPVESLIYLLAVFRYIELNASAAGVRTDPLAYPYGSAIHIVSDENTLPWLSRDCIDELMASLLREGVGRVEAYRRILRLGEDVPGISRLVETRLEHPSRAADDVDSLFCAHGARWLEWFQQRAQEADGTKLGLPAVDAESICEVVAARRTSALGAVLPAPRGQARNLWDVVEAGLLHDLGGKNYTEIARCAGTSPSTATRRYEAHCSVLHDDRAYATVLVELARAAIEQCFGSLPLAVASRIAEGRLRLP